jgi:hypothetical protein
MAENAYGGHANGIPRNWCVSPFAIPTKTASSSRTSGELAARGCAADCASPRVWSEAEKGIESCTAKGFVGEASVKSAWETDNVRAACFSSIEITGDRVAWLSVAS